MLIAFPFAAHAQQAPATSDLKPGLIATYKDDVQSVSEVVALPELGLAAEESSHPTIKPAFTVRFEGFLDVMLPGTYQFDTKKATLTINGKPVAGEHKLDAGKHALVLIYQREPGNLAFGVSWQSEHFVKEPLPPTVLWHAPGPQLPENANGTFAAPSHRIGSALAAMKCASCHDGNFLSTMHHKFAPDSLLTLMRHANPPKVYGALTGPLLEVNDSLTQLANDLRKLPHGQRVRGAEVATQPNAAKRMVGTKQGLACIACHDLKNHKTEAESKGPNLAFTTERVSYDWFVRWMENPGRLKPGVPMPPFFASQEAGERQKNIDALWDYLAQGQKMELPDELLVDPNRFILKPGKDPVYTRTYFRLPDGRELLRAICVGLPNGVSYCFDSETCQLVYVWTGGFLNMAPHWQNQSGMLTPAIGAAFYPPSKEEGLRIGQHKPAFRGYEIVNGIPRFEFTLGEATVHLRIDSPSPDSIQQNFTITKRSEPITYLAPPAKAAVSLTSTLGTWAEKQLTISETSDIEFTLTTERTK